MTQHPAGDIHPREIELAKFLKAQNLEMEVKTGDWFVDSDGVHVIMNIAEKNGDTVLKCQHDKWYRKDGVLIFPHRRDCHDWLSEREYNLHDETLPDGRVKVTCTRRHTEFKIEKIEPSELAGIYSVMIEVINILDFGGM